MVDFTVLTIFPDMFVSFRTHGMIRRAIEQNKISFYAIDIRDYAQGKHYVTDDRPYGGGCGMVMKPEPLAYAIRAAKHRMPHSKTILLTPQGRTFCQDIALELAAMSGLIFVCGRYEGIDERIYQDYVEDELSIGDYVLTGGELPAMVIIDAVARLIPGVLGGDDSASKDSFSTGLLEHAHYTRPSTFENATVPEVLLSGDHRKIETWRLESSLIRTFLKRKDLLESRVLSDQEVEILKKWCHDIEKIVQSKSLCGTDSLSGKE